MAGDGDDHADGGDDAGEDDGDDTDRADRGDADRVADRDDAGRVVSLGSINVDRIRDATPERLATLTERYDWFPDPGETVTLSGEPDPDPAAVVAAELSAEPDRVRHGGKGANQAVAAARAGADATLLGKVGPDHEEFGVLAELADAGVDTGRIAVADEPTGTAFIFVEPDGENRIVVRPGANGAVDREYVREQSEVVRAADCLLVQNEVPVDPVAALLADLADDPERPTVVVDPAPPGGVERLLATGAVDVCTPNDHEYEALSGALDAAGTVVRTRGADDVLVEGDHEFAVAPPAVDPVDTTGAGDVLAGFLAARLAAGASVRDAVEAGTVAGALSTEAEGARGGIPTSEDVQAARD